MGWVNNKWFPRWPGDYCTGWYAPPTDGSAPIWERKDPDYEGTQDHSPKWVMLNGRELSHEDVARKQGDTECEIVPYGKVPPHRTYVEKYFCYSCRLWLCDEDDVLSHFGGNKSFFGQWKKGMGMKDAPKEEAPKPKIDVPENIAAELRAFLEPIVASNEKFVGLWKQGKIGPLVGAAMRENKGKYEGKFIEAMLKEVVGV